MRQRCGGLSLNERDRFAAKGADGDRIFKYLLNKLDDSGDCVSLAGIGKGRCAVNTVQKIQFTSKFVRFLLT